MIPQLAAVVQLGQGPEIAKEGLPFWIFWFLLSVILLLVFFIFLRDKEMRRRLSIFLSGAKRKMLRLRLQAMVKKERARKTELWKELGRQAWSEDIRVAGIDPSFNQLAELDKLMTAARLRWHEIYMRIEEKSGPEEIAGLEKEREAVQRRIIELKRLSEPLYESVGKIMDEIRPDHEGLALFYFQIDGIDKRIRNLKERIEWLR
jgi:hypothetical protein